MRKKPGQPFDGVCGAKKRDGTTCQKPPELGKRRCWGHGGAPGTGAPVGNQNAFKHGYYSAAAEEERCQTRELLAEAEDLLARLKG